MISSGRKWRWRQRWNTGRKHSPCKRLMASQSHWSLALGHTWSHPVAGWMTEQAHAGSRAGSACRLTCRLTMNSCSSHLHVLGEQTGGVFPAPLFSTVWDGYSACIGPSAGRLFLSRPAGKTASLRRGVPTFLAHLLTPNSLLIAFLFLL